MVDDAALRKRRSRAHKRGDHSLCNPVRCTMASASAGAAQRRLAVEPEPEPAPALETEPTSFPPAARRAPNVSRPDRPEFDARGERLWHDLTKRKDLTPAQRALIEEACRLVDRLDKLDAVLRGDPEYLARAVPDEGTGNVVLVVNNVLAEARQQQRALTSVFAELRQTGIDASRAPTKPVGVNGLADLTARIEARRASATS